MKSLKVILMSFICVIILFTVAGCGDKKTIAFNNFKTKMEANGYIVSDVTTQSSDNYVEKAFLALDKDSKYQIEFYNLSNEDNAKQFFNSNKAIFEESKSSEAIETSESTENSAKYTLEVNGKYKVISRVDNTVIYIDANATYKSAIEAALKKIEY